MVNRKTPTDPTADGGPKEGNGMGEHYAHLVVLFMQTWCQRKGENNLVFTGVLGNQIAEKLPVSWGDM